MWLLCLSLQIYKSVRKVITHYFAIDYESSKSGRNMVKLYKLRLVFVYFVIYPTVFSLYYISWRVIIYNENIRAFSYCMNFEREVLLHIKSFVQYIQGSLNARTHQPWFKDWKISIFISPEGDRIWMKDFRKRMLNFINVKASKKYCKNLT